MWSSDHLLLAKRKSFHTPQTLLGITGPGWQARRAARLRRRPLQSRKLNDRSTRSQGYRSPTATGTESTIFMSGIHEESLTRRTGSTRLGIRLLRQSSRCTDTQGRTDQYRARSEVPVHRFCNREARYRLVVEGAAWAGDMTCQGLRHNGCEFGLPSQNCGAIIGMTFGFHVAAGGTAYLLHRLGWHQLSAPALVRHRFEHLRNDLQRRAFQRTHAVRLRRWLPGSSWSFTIPGISIRGFFRRWDVRDYCGALWLLRCARWPGALLARRKKPFPKSGLRC